MGYELVVAQGRSRNRVSRPPNRSLFGRDAVSPERIIDPSEPGPPAFGRLRRSTDRGAHWTEIDQALIGTTGMTSITAFALDSRTPGRLYAAAVVTKFEPLAPVFTPVFESNDRGTTWTELRADTPAIFTGFLVDPFQASSIYGSAPGGILRSEDGGRRSIRRAPCDRSDRRGFPSHRTALCGDAGERRADELRRGNDLDPVERGPCDLAVSDLALDASSGFLYAVTGSAYSSTPYRDRKRSCSTPRIPSRSRSSAADPHTGATASGVATQVNDLWGYFSIPAITGNPGNPEVFVKLLDGTAINGDYWFFYGGLTNLEYTLTVTDATTGKQKTYTKPAGSECGGSDTAAFAP